MKISTCVARYAIALCLLFVTTLNSYAQRIYAGTQRHGTTGLLCVNCTVTSPENAADANVQSYSTLNVAVGLAASTWQELIFAGTTKVAAGTPVSVKLGTGDNLLSATVLGGITLQAYNGNTAIDNPVPASTLISALSNSNQFEATITPSKSYDRIRVTLTGGLVGALSSLYLYEGFYNGTGNGACNSAVDELHGISAGLLNLGLNVGGVVNPQNAMDGDLNTYSTLNAGVGLVGAYAQQTIIYEAPSVKGDSVRLTLAIPDGLIQAGIIPNISVSTFNGNSGTAETYALNSSLLKLQLLGLLANNNRKVTVTYAPVNIFDRVQLTLGGIANVLSTLNFYDAQKLIPKPVIKVNGIVTNNASICDGSTATLVATASPNTAFLWYTTATGGAAVFTGASFTTPALTATTTYYVAAMRTGCTDESERTAVTVTANTIPANPVITNATLTVCPGQQATFIAQAVAGETVNWYTDATGGTAVATGNTFTTGALTQTTKYFAEAVAGGTCVSPGRTAVTATVSTLPAAPGLTTPNVTICDGDVAVFSVASPGESATYNWYTTATGGTPVYTGVAFTSPVLHASTNYYVEAVNANSCASSTRTQASVTVTPKPADPVLSANNSSIAAGQTATINVTNTQTGITYNWYTSATAATSIFTGTSFTTPQLYTNTTYYVAAVNATGCQSANRTAITINVTIDTNTPCSFANTQTNTVNNICIGCSVTNPVLAVDADTTTASAINVSAGLVGGYAQQFLLFQQPGFKGDTIKLELGTSANLLDAGVAGNIQVALYNGNIQVESYALNNALVQLSLLSGGSRYAVYIPANGAYDRVRVRVTSGVATLLTALQLYYAVQQYPKPVFNPLTPEICSGSKAVINVTSPTNGTFQWFTTPTGGTAAVTGSSFTTPALTANTTYYIGYTRGTCVSPVRYPVQILVNTPPAAPVVEPSTTAVFSGQTATFTADVENNITVKWYSASSGGTPLFTGTTFTTPALTSPTTYYAESSTGDCVSTTRTPGSVTIKANVVPNVSVNPPSQTINPGTTATLVASSTTPGTIFNWYTTPTGGSSIYTGATFTTPPIFAPTTYYAEAVVTASGTTSANRASGVVNVTSSTVNPTPCDAAISQTSDINGLVCLLCSINNPAGSVDADRNTFSQLDVSAGLANAYGQQTLRFANTGRAGDTVVVELGIPASLANINVLSQISLATYNGATYNNDRFNINSSLTSITLLNGTSRFRYAFVATQDFDRVEIRLNSTVAGVLNALNIYDAYEEVTAPVISTSNITACQGTQATITATVPSYVTVRWYTTPTGGTPVFTGAVFNTPVLNNTTTYYAEASRTADGCAQSVRTPATVTVTPVPNAPVVTAPTQMVCSGSPATFTAQAVNGVTFSWYTAATGGIPVFTGNPFTTPALNTTASYYVEANGAGSCGSSTRTLVTANVTTTPVVPVVSQSTVQTCSGSSAVLTATSNQPGVTFNWYTTATGGTPVFTGEQYTTPSLTANTSYFVEAASGQCASPTRAQADVVVNPTPAQPVVTVTPAGEQISSGQTATLKATSGTAGVTFNWYTTATSGTPIFTGPTYVTPALTSTITYYVDATLTSTGCISPNRTAVTIIVNPVFSTSCDFASTQTNTTSGLLCLLCNVAGPNNSVNQDTTDFTQLNLPVGVLNGFVSQTLMFDNPGLLGDTVTVRLRIPAAVLGVNVLSHIQINSLSAGVDNGDEETLDNAAIKLKLLSAGQDVLIKFVPKKVYDAVRVELVNNGVSLLGSLDIFYASKQVEQPLLAANTVNICSGAMATFSVSNARTGLTYKWYNAASGGTLLHTGANYTTAALTTTQTFYVESSRTATGCVNPNRVAATANVTPSPVNPVLAQAAVTICAGDNTTLSVTNAGAQTVQWFDSATGGNLLFTGASFQVSPIIITKYYAELTNGSCTSPARTVATVTVNPRPSQAGVQSANLVVCMGSTATIVVLNPETGVTYSYYTQATGGIAAGTGTTFTTPGITQNTIYYIEASSASGCTNNGGRAMVNITVTNQVNSPTLSATQRSVCSGGSVTISVNNPAAGLSYNWFTDAAGGTPVFTGTVFTMANVSADAKYYVEAVNSSGCTSSGRTETDITVIPVPTPPQVQASTGGLSVCSGSSATLSIVNPQPDFVYRWYDAATNGTLLFTGTEYLTPPLTSATTYYVEASSAGNCNPSTRTKATITINPLPADPTLVAGNVSVCAGNSATLVINSPQTGVSYQWYDSPAKTNLLFTGTTYITGPINNTTDFYVVALNSSGCSSNDEAQAQVTIQSAPGAPVIANGSTVQSCTGSQVTLTIANPAAGFTYNWYTAATGGTPVATGASFTTGALTANTTYYAEAANSTGCTSANRTPVDINVNSLPAAPTITAQGGSTTPNVCAGSDVTLTATSATPNVTFNWYTQATGGTIAFTGATYITTLTQNTTYYVEAVSNIGGCSSSTRGSIQVTVTQPPATPTVTSASVSVCTGSTAALSVSNPQNSLIYNWYDSATKTNLLHTGPDYTTSPVTAGATYYVEAVNGTCSSPSLASVQVKVEAAPVAPVISNGNQVNTCQSNQVTLSIGNPQTGFTYNWYTDPTGGTPVATGVSFTTGALTGNVTYYAEATNAGGCNSAGRTSVAIVVNNLPDPPTITAQGGSTTPTACAGSDVTLTATSNTPNVTFNWYTTATGGTIAYTGVSYTTTVTQNTTYYVEAVSNTGGCSSTTRGSIKVTVTQPPATPGVTSANVSVCTGGAATLSVADPQTGFTYNWYDSATKSNLLHTGPDYTTGQLTANATYYVEAMNGTCSSPSLASVQVHVEAAPAVPVVSNGNQVNTCQSSQVTLTINNPQTGFTYNWYTDPTGGTAIATGTSFTTGALTASVTYYVEATNTAGCTSSGRTAVAIVVNNLPDPPTITAQGGASTPTICGGSDVTLTATSNTANVTFNWYTSATGGTPIFTGATYKTTPTQSTTYYVEAVSNSGGCSSTTRGSIQVTVTQPPTTPTVVSVNVSVCTGSNATLSVSNPQSSLTYNWYDSATKVNLLFTGPDYTTGRVNANATYYVEAENGSCSSPSLASVQVKTVPAPGAPLITNGSQVTTCQSTQVMLTISNPQSGFTYNWYTSAAGGASVAIGTSFTTPVLTAGTIYYAEATNSNSCPSATRTPVNIIVSHAPNAPTVAAPTVSICPGSTAILTATSNDPDATIKWYSSGTGGTALATGGSFTTPIVNATTTYYAEAVNNSSSCVSPSRAAVTVSILEKLDPPAVTVATTSPTSITFEWSPIANATGYQVSTDNGATFIDPSSGANGTTDIIAGLQPGAKVTIIVRAVAGTACQISANSEAVTGTATNPNGNAIFVPNAFTPNGDGKNDIEYVYGTSINSLKFTVYNQWGQLIFTSLSKSSGWDGTYKGTRQPVGVYVYYVEAVMNDGQQVKQKGTITLLR